MEEIDVKGVFEPSDWFSVEIFGSGDVWVMEHKKDCSGLPYKTKIVDKKTIKKVLCNLHKTQINCLRVEIKNFIELYQKYILNPNEVYPNFRTPRDKDRLLELLIRYFEENNI